MPTSTESIDRVLLAALREAGRDDSRLLAAARQTPVNVDALREIRAHYEQLALVLFQYAHRRSLSPELLLAPVLLEAHKFAMLWVEDIDTVSSHGHGPVGRADSIVADTLVAVLTARLAVDGFYPTQRLVGFCRIAARAEAQQSSQVLRPTPT